MKERKVARILASSTSRMRVSRLVPQFSLPFSLQRLADSRNLVQLLQESSLTSCCQTRLSQESYLA